RARGRGRRLTFRTLVRRELTVPSGHRPSSRCGHGDFGKTPRTPSYHGEEPILRKYVPRIAAALLLAALAIAAAGCGGGGNKSAATTTTNGGGGQLAANQSLIIAIGAEPPSLDPGLATDTTSANVLYNIMDPLVKLGPLPDLKPLPNLAQSWDVN